jgi:GT2 family glycosyltransferase
VGITTYNSEDYIEQCLESVLRVVYKPLTIVVFDNASLDDTPKILRDYEDRFRVTYSKKNLGYAEACNRIAKMSNDEFLFILNPDTVVKSDFLNPLVAAMIEDDKVAAAQPLVYLLNEDIINLTGKKRHILGFDWIKDFGATKPPKPQLIESFSGSGVLMRRKVFNELGGYDSSYFMYYEDSDLSWRMSLSGYKIVFVPESVISHDYKFVPDENLLTLKRKLYLNERNRLTSLMKNYSLKTLVVLFPIFAFMEMSLLTYFLFKGWLLEKLKGYASIFLNFDQIIKERRHVGRMRKVEDRELMKNMSCKLKFSHYEILPVRYVIDPIVCAYWSIASNLI